MPGDQASRSVHAAVSRTLRKSSETARQSLKNSRISPRRKCVGEHSSNGVILRVCVHIVRFPDRGSCRVFRPAAISATLRIVLQRAHDHRRGRPEVKRSLAPRIGNFRSCFRFRFRWVLPNIRKCADAFAKVLSAATHDGRLAATFGPRPFFGKLSATATREAAARFMATWYRRTCGRGQRRLVAVCRVTVPVNYAATLVSLRNRLGLSQQQLADEIGAATKAVVYQWESGRRKPSPVFWLRIERLRRSQRLGATRA